MTILFSESIKHNNKARTFPSQYATDLINTCDMCAASLENVILVYAKTKALISCAITAQLISAFVFASLIVQFLFFLNPKFQASSNLMWPHRPVCVGPGRGSFNVILIELRREETCLWHLTARSDRNRAVQSQ